MCGKMGCLYIWIFALVAIVWFFSRVGFQMSPQTDCQNRCKVTLVAFVWFLSRASFQIASLKRYIDAAVCLLYFFLCFIKARHFWRRCVHVGDELWTKVFPWQLKVLHKSTFYFPFHVLWDNRWTKVTVFSTKPPMKLKGIRESLGWYTNLLRQ